jgi:hypothetical protein
MEKGGNPLGRGPVGNQEEGLGEGVGPPPKGQGVKAGSPGKQGLQNPRAFLLEAGQKPVEGLGEVKEGLAAPLGKKPEEVGLQRLKVDPGEVQEVHHRKSVP